MSFYLHFPLDLEATTYYTTDFVISKAMFYWAFQKSAVTSDLINVAEITEKHKPTWRYILTESRSRKQILVDKRTPASFGRKSATITCAAVMR